jgi:hypothetical protein
VKFDLVRPCKDCPFRTDIPAYLSRARVREITSALIDRQATFTCHKTNAFDDDEDGNSCTVETKDSQHCAGALIFLERLQRPNQMMRWMERIGAYDRTKLDIKSPVFRSAAEMVKAQPRRGVR